MHPELRRWTAFAGNTACALYWVSTALLWYPWSVSEALGITLMLTVSPVLWALGTVQILVRWPGGNLWAAASWTAAIMAAVSVLTDLVFFGVVRDALDDLLRPTTYAGYGWVVLLPFLTVVVARRWLHRRRAATPCALGAAAGTALAALATVVVLIVASAP